MVSIKKITKFELPDYIKIAYEGDEDLFKKYHVEEFDFKDAVNSTVGMIDLISQQVQMVYFKIQEDSNDIGYLVVFKNNLYSFGINKNYRTAKILFEFWSYIKKILGDSFICMLFPNNTRAINWLIKCGMSIVEGVEETAVTLIYNKPILNTIN